MEEENISNEFSGVAQKRKAPAVPVAPEGIETDVGEGVRVYVTPETAADLGLMVFDIQKTAKADVIVMSARDFDLKAAAKTPEEKAVVEKIDLMQARKQVQNLSQEEALVLLEISRRELDRHLSSIGFDKDRLSMGATMQLVDLPLQAMAGFPSAGYLVDSKENPKFAIFVTSDPTISGKAWISRVSGIPEDKLADIPGTPREWAFMINRHELGHLDHILDYAKKEEANLSETKSDQDAIFAYQEGLKNGHFKTAELPQLLIDLRAIKYVFSSKGDSDAHATSARLVLSEDEMNMSMWMPMKPQDSLGIRNMVRDRVASDTSITRDEAGRFMTEQPELFYETIKTMNREGAFQGNQHSQRYVDQFIAAAERIAPAYFHVEPGMQTSIPVAAPSVTPEPDKYRPSTPAPS